MGLFSKLKNANDYLDCVTLNEVEVHELFTQLETIARALRPEDTIGACPSGDDRYVYEAIIQQILDGKLVKHLEKFSKYDDLVKSLEGNNVSGVADFLHSHYREISKQSLKGYTPNPDLARYWRAVSSKALAMGRVKQ